MDVDREHRERRAHTASDGRGKRTTAAPPLMPATRHPFTQEARRVCARLDA